MHITVILCCYVLLPYLASIVSPPQEAITCNAFEIIRKCIRVSEEVSFEEEIRPKQRSFTMLDKRNFEQKVDHYHFTDTRKWLQKYLIYDGHYKGNGIIFLKIGTALEITDVGMQTGRWYEYCIQAKALCIGIEQRGYGVTLPNNDLSRENLKYFNTEQALADVAWFIYNFRGLKTGHELPEKLKWVAYGKSKQGSLAVWLRMKYPHLVHSTLTISAPVLAKVDFDDFFNLIEIDMLDEEPKLKNAIKEAYNEVIKLVNNGSDQRIGKLLNFCEQKLLTNQKDKKKNIDFMYFTLAQTVALVMRYGKDDLILTKNRVTDIMLGREDKYKNKSLIKRFAILIMKVSKKTCIRYDYYMATSGYSTRTISGLYLLDYPMTVTFGELAEFYQNCNEFGHFQTFDNFFGTKIDLKFYTEFCETVFGERFKNHLGTQLGVRRTNVFYGGYDIVVSRAIYVYGDKDPYSKLGIMNTNPGHTVTHVLKGVRHCEELDKLKDVPEINDVKQAIFKQLTEWLKSPENNEEKDNYSKIKPDEIMLETENPEISEKDNETVIDG